MKKAVVIGSGVAGMAVAIRMAVKGYAVSIYETNNYPGGKLTEITTEKYRFDAGPSLFTMPEYFEELFELAGKSFSDYCSYDRLDVITNYFFADGTTITAWADIKKFAQEVSQVTLDEAESIIKHLSKSKKLYDLSADIFLKSSLHKVKQQKAKNLIKAGLYLNSLNLFKTMHSSNRSSFKDSKTIQLFDRYATYNGSNPYQAPGILNVIPHLEFNVGAFFPKNGMISLTNSLVQLGKELGVTYNFNTRVDSIVHNNKIATGIEVDGETIQADIVISDADIFPTYRKLLNNHKPPNKILKQERSSSALIFYWGIKSTFDQLDLHNIFFSSDYEKEFTTLFKEKTISSDPTVYINISSKLKRDDAPKDCENWFVMINVPSNEGQDWDKLISIARKNILSKLSKTLGRNIEDLIESEDILDPRLIESKTSSHKGSLYGSSSNNKLAAFLRHANDSSNLKNLYFCGGSVHPGGGIPLCMLSAYIVDRLIHD